MTTAVAIVVLMFALSAGLVIAGVHMLAGTAWAMIAAAALLFLAALRLSTGLARNG